MIEQNLTAAVIPHDACWMIEPAAGRAYWEALKAESLRTHIEIHAAQKPNEPDTPAEPKPFRFEDGTAFFSLSGPMTKKPTSYGSGTSTVRLREQIRKARRDPDVTQGFLIIDSPGGSVSGTSDLAAEIAQFAAEKPLIAYIEDCCCSAAMWCASQCSQVFANPTALVGSIGTVMVLDDQSRRFENAGIEVLVFGTGKFKGAGTQGSRITEEQRAHFQAMVDDLNMHFAAAIRAGRRVTDEQMETLLHAGVFVGQQAVEMGLVDKIATFEEALSLSRQLGRENKPPVQGKEKKPMVRAKLASALARLGMTTHAIAVMGATSDEPDAIAQTLAEFEGENNTQAEETGRENAAAAAATTPSFEESEAYKRMQAQLDLLQQQNAQLIAGLAQQQATTRLERNTAEINRLVRQMRLTPATAETWKRLASDNPAAFEAALPALQGAPVIPQLRGSAIKSSGAQVGAEDPAGKLVSLATEMAAKTGKDLETCLTAIAQQHPDLANQHAAQMEKAIYGGGN